MGVLAKGRDEMQVTQTRSGRERRERRENSAWIAIVDTEKPVQNTKSVIQMQADLLTKPQAQQQKDLPSQRRAKGETCELHMFLG